MNEISIQMDNGPIEALQTYQRQQQEALILLRRQDSRWSWIRLLTVLVGAIPVVMLITGQQWLGAALTGVVTAVAFVVTVSRHAHWQRQRIATESLLKILSESLQQPLVTGQPVRCWQCPTDPASPDMRLPTILPTPHTWALTDQEREDLDLYSPPLGLFGRLNRTSSRFGARRLRDILDAPLQDIAAIEQRQATVNWLSQDMESRLKLMASVLPLRSHDEPLDRLVQALHHTSAHNDPNQVRFLRIWSLLSGSACLIMVGLIFTTSMAWISPLLGLLILNGLLWLIFKRVFCSLRQAVVPFIGVRGTILQLLSHSDCACEVLPNETSLAKLRDVFVTVSYQVKLSSLCDWLDWAGLGAVVRNQLNLLFFFDLHAGEAVLKRLVPYRDTLLQSLAAMAELEALNSLACFAGEQAGTTLPLWQTDTSLEIQAGNHPLIDPTEAVANDIHLDAATRAWVITGPNAAGKSTFVRMVGANVLLAHIGSAVLAQSMSLSVLRLITDVRVRDDLAKHESYFLSEVRRLRRLVMDQDKDVPLLGLIDEPFRGTNSPERTAAGVALLEHLLASGHLFLLATHEDQLARTAAQSQAAQNVHFQERLNVQGVEFDYQLHQGPASTRTAIRILEQEQYPTSLLQRARELMQANDTSDF